ncbi:MAG: hypothetical protein Q4B35_06450 [Slackia sp.]|nr:hypothetical protein [Slackia sp.]
MTGESVCVLRRRADGRDDMGEPVYAWDQETVDDVLVRPLSPSDVEDPERPDAVRASYALAFPKAYTAHAAPLAHARVALVSRGMDPSDAQAAHRVIGSPDIVRPCPTKWNMNVLVAAADG